MHCKKQTKKGVMKMKIYTVYDSKAETHRLPFYSRSNGEAIRKFTDVINDSEQNEMSLHSEDYTLYYIAEYDEITGTIVPMQHQSLGKGIEYKKQDKTPDMFPEMKGGKINEVK